MKNTLTLTYCVIQLKVRSSNRKTTQRGLLLFLENVLKIDWESNHELGFASDHFIKT